MREEVFSFFLLLLPFVLCCCVMMRYLTLYLDLFLISVICTLLYQTFFESILGTTHYLCPLRRARLCSHAWCVAIFGLHQSCGLCYCTVVGDGILGSVRCRCTKRALQSPADLHRDMGALFFPLFLHVHFRSPCTNQNHAKNAIEV